MTALLFIVWIAQVLVAYAILFFVQLPLRRGNSRVLRAVVFAVKILLFVLFAYLSISIISRVTWNAGYTFGAVYVALGGDILSDIVAFPFVIARKNKNCIAIRAIAGIVLTLAFLIYGTVNMQSVKANEINITSDKLKKSHRFVFLSDLHFGSAQSFETVEKAIFDIAAKRPEFILLGGDITDELSSKEEMETIYSLLSATDVPVYFIYGNHDRQPDGALVGGPEYTEEELENTMRSYGIIILKDSMVRISDDLVILGREDVSRTSRKAVSELPALPENAYVVCVDHSPYQTQDIILTGADLQLSGHTHAGQFFPLQLVYNLTGHDAYGFYRHGDTDLYVSSGIAGWLFPFRSEAGCRYELVTLTPSLYK